MIININPDKQKANSLRNMARITLERLNKTDIEEYPSNTLMDYYDILHKLMEAFAIERGIKIKGDGAHIELINYVAKFFKLNEDDRQFLQQIRDYRNRIFYEGFIVNKNYISLNRKRIINMINKFLI